MLGGEGDGNTNLSAINEVVAGVATDVEGTDRAPTQAQRAVLAASNERLERAGKLWQSLKSGDLAAFNQRLKQAGLNEVKVPTTAEIDAAESGESKDLP